MGSKEATIIRGILGLADDGIKGELADMGVAGQTDPFDEKIVIREAAELPYGGDWTGKEGLRDLMTRIASLAKLTPIDVEVFDAGDGCVITRQTAKLTHEASGDELSIPMVEVYKLVDEKIVEIDVYYKDTKAMVDFFTSHPA